MCQYGMLKMLLNIKMTEVQASCGFINDTIKIWDAVQFFVLFSVVSVPKSRSSHCFLFGRNKLLYVERNMTAVRP
jgi:hypothetical protein